MNYKVKGAIEKNKKSFIVFGILWLIMAIVLVTPIAYSSHIAKLDTEYIDLGTFIETFMSVIKEPLTTFGKVFSEGAGSEYFETLIIVTIISGICFFVGFVKSAPKNRYTDIEHGSSDWSKKGEQYEILNKDKGIILAENNYLPVDKRGNVNVLVVGRFWFTESLLRIQYLMHIKCLDHIYLLILRENFMIEQQDI